MSETAPTLSLKSKIILGFLTVTGVLIVSSGISYVKFSGVATHFDTYRQSAQEGDAIQDLSEDMLDLRRMIREYWAGGRTSMGDSALKAAEQAMGSVAKVESDVKNPMHKEFVTSIGEMFRTYRSEAEKMVSKKREMTQKLASATETGVAAIASLEEIANEARKNGSSGQALIATTLIAEFFEARVSMIKTVYNNDADTTAETEEIFVRLKKNVGDLTSQLAGTPFASKAKEATGMITSYVDYALAVMQAKRDLDKQVNAMGAASQKMSASVDKALKDGSGYQHQISDEMASSIDNSRTLLVIVSIIGALLGIGLGIVIGTKIANDQKAIDEAKERRARLMEEYSRDFENRVQQALKALDSDSDNMHNAAQKLTMTAEAASSRATDVSAAAEEASANVQIVAAATTELSTSITEISGNVSQSNVIAAKAVSEAAETTATITRLAEAAQKIGEVVALINDIAGQTNLLALNATIEAARAGEAGKGFAVVASEVKNLATQTAHATEEITSQIGGMQQVTQEAVAAIERINATISSMGAISTSIASAIEEQTAATGEISRNVQEAANGTSSVSKNMSSVNKGAMETGEEAGTVLSAAGSLKTQTDTLRQAVDSYLGKVKAV